MKRNEINSTCLEEGNVILERKTCPSCLDLNDRISHLEKKNRDTHASITRLTSQVETLQRSSRYTLWSILTSLLRRLLWFFGYGYTKSKTSPAVQTIYTPKLHQLATARVLLHCGVQQKLEVEISLDLQKWLIHNMGIQDFNLQVDLCHDPQKRPAGLPLIVLCINASRLGTDVKQALNNIMYERSIAVAILHYMKIHALPLQSSERLLTGEDYKQLGLIVDLAYTTGDGFYECEMNTRSINMLCEFIKKFDKSS